jgi:hypothetical protein
MKLRHAAALALVGWMLVIPAIGKTIPKDCQDCAVTLEANAERARGFKSKAECEKTGEDWFRNFYADVRKNDNRVVFPPSKPCCVKNEGK